MLLKNTTKHEIRFPHTGGKRDEIVFPAGQAVEVSDEEVKALEGSRVASAWLDAGDLSPYAPMSAEAKKPDGGLEETDGGETETEPKA